MYILYTHMYIVYMCKNGEFNVWAIAVIMYVKNIYFKCQKSTKTSINIINTCSNLRKYLLKLFLVYYISELITKTFRFRGTPVELHHGPSWQRR